MIPTISQILSDYSAGQISKNEAIRLINEHLRLDRIEYGEHIKAEAVKVCRDTTMDYLSDQHYKGWLDGRDKCAAAIAKMEIK